jgi:DnaJ-class molecular chaperone
MIRMPGRGEAASGGAAGDLYVKLHVKKDQIFVRDGSNLVTVLKIRLSDALLGGSQTIKTLDGEETITIPEGVSHGEIIKIKGRGVPSQRGSRGDILVRIDIELPKKLSKEARTLVEKLRDAGV